MIRKFNSPEQKKKYFRAQARASRCKVLMGVWEEKYREAHNRLLECEKKYRYYEFCYVLAKKYTDKFPAKKKRGARLKNDE